MIRVAALTSYSDKGLDAKIMELASAGETILDLYCFCPADLDALGCPESQKPWPEWILERLDDPYLDLAAKKFRKICDRVMAKTGCAPIDVCGTATFFPDLSLPGGNASLNCSRKVSVEVLKRILEFMAALRKEGFTCRTMELVAGQTVIRSGPTRPPTEPKLKLLQDSDCIKAIRMSLSDILRARKRIFRGDRMGEPYLAFEIEPGTCLLRDKDSLLEFLHCLNMNRRVGINVDIGHLIILDMQPEDVFNSKLAPFVTHAHVSDNARSHFADLPVASVHGSDVFKKWLAKLSAHHALGKGMYQGYVSVEMEAWGSVDAVCKSCRQVRRWVGGRKIPRGNPA